jgi:hypothetical protein
MKEFGNYLLIFFLTIILVSGCNSKLSENLQTSETGIEYYYFEIDGMPCIYVERNQPDNNATGGPSCDWSRWQGEGK